ncbi:hypothetical protein SDRG_09388 [Saprolegnia diclina VS20]|uniref:Ubiquitin-like domain-containing protein n=1 Tax=Saprolegnia diclina (strain VS20) TaxID=1156394 RepID=T0RKI6_SAPDV|nr:hypothetical protein SDRG_09388 [Saprolegnia diclina VS20]EQC32853.1 hypothetical protein SDRG_09388 [Saprolegnia diclina VS20]|eukprot:XP_008613539.1 hypothetical protein SDRG_09388 [Saprolegnia diclina VS20]
MSIKLFIKNEIHSIQLQFDVNDSIAAVKAAYQKSGKVQGRLDYIVLLHRGKELQDEKSIAEHGINDGAILVHIETLHEPFRPVNYAVLADAIKQRHLHEQANLKMMQQDGTMHHLGFDKSIISRSSPKSTPLPRQKSSGRTFFNQVSVLVNGCSYHVLPSMEGRWNGELESIPSQDEGTQVCSCELTFREEEGVWNLRQMRTSISGLTTTQHLWIKPAADGVLKLETDDPSLRGSDITMREVGANILIITATSKRTGRPVMVETITSIDSTRRLRTVQRFDETGGFRFVYVMNERRVVDAVSGAMERYDPNF